MVTIAIISEKENYIKLQLSMALDAGDNSAKFYLNFIQRFWQKRLKVTCIPTFEKGYVCFHAHYSNVLHRGSSWAKRLFGCISEVYLFASTVICASLQSWVTQRNVLDLMFTVHSSHASRAKNPYGTFTATTVNLLLLRWVLIKGK